MRVDDKGWVDGDASPDPARYPTAEEWVAWFRALDDERAVEVAGRVIKAQAAASDCFVRGHESQIERLRGQLDRADVRIRQAVDDRADLEARVRRLELAPYEANRRAIDRELGLLGMPVPPPPAAGRCGVAGPSLLPPVDGVPAAVPACVLEAGHAGWHRGNDGSEWSMRGELLIDEECGCGHDHGQKGSQPAVCPRCVWCRIDVPKTPSQLLLEEPPPPPLVFRRPEFDSPRRRAGRRPWWRFWGA